MFVFCGCRAGEKACFCHFNWRWSDLTIYRRWLHNDNPFEKALHKHDLLSPELCLTVVKELLISLDWLTFRLGLKLAPKLENILADTNNIFDICIFSCPGFLNLKIIMHLGNLFATCQVEWVWHFGLDIEFGGQNGNAVRHPPFAKPFLSLDCSFILLPCKFPKYINHQLLYDDYNFLHKSGWKEQSVVFHGSNLWVEYLEDIMSIYKFQIQI